jgi:SEC-C motif-containing protein
MPDACPCGSGRPLAECCGPLLSGAPAPTAEALMRSRYTAFATGAVEHLVRTHAKPTSANEREEIAQWCAATKWLALTIRKTERGGEKDLEGYVEFSARFLEDRELWVLEERSRFERREAAWVYIDGMARRFREPKPGRNDACPCGSGKKFKQCHGA